MAINSKQKGKRGELELVHYLKSRGIEARRGQQYAGGEHSPDVIAGLPLERFHLEVKRREAGNVYKWMEQAMAECGSRYPMVAHKKNGKVWLAILPFDVFLAILNQLEKFKETP